LQRDANEFLQELNIQLTGLQLGLEQGALGINLSSNVDTKEIQNKINERIEAKKAKNFAEADRIRKELADAGIILEDTPQGTTWRRA
jgi:cysteinyl-tRNA synthetase